MKTRHHQVDAEALGDHIDRLYRAARCLCRSPQEAEDLVQQAFGRAGKKRWRRSAKDDLPYLVSVLRDTFIARAAATRPQTPSKPDALELEEDATVPLLEHRLDPGHVYRAIAALAPDLRDAVTAVDVVGLSRHEGARALCVGEATIATSLHHGRQRIALALSGRGCGWPPLAGVGPKADLEYALATRHQARALAVPSEVRERPSELANPQTLIGRSLWWKYWSRWCCSPPTSAPRSGWADGPGR
jgi:RNA polymerase sigma-70 factor (ECF subfamily)